MFVSWYEMALCSKEPDIVHYKTCLKKRNFYHRREHPAFKLTAKPLHSKLFPMTVLHVIGSGDRYVCHQLKTGQV
jgi:hypothetical protein